MGAMGKMVHLDEVLSLASSEDSTAQLGAFAVHLWRFGMNQQLRGNAYSTIYSKLCAIRWYHRFNLGYDSGLTAQHALLRGIRRFSDPVVK